MNLSQIEATLQYHSLNAFCLPSASFTVWGNDTSISLELCGDLRYHLKAVISQSRDYIVWFFRVPLYIWRYAKNSCRWKLKGIIKALILFISQFGHKCNSQFGHKCKKHRNLQDKIPTLLSDDYGHRSYIDNGIF
jgi:hypothetical protein